MFSNRSLRLLPARQSYALACCGKQRTGGNLVSEHLITPSKITAWLECQHYLTLDSEVAAGIRTRPYSVTGSYAELLRDKGVVHEKACLAAIKAQDKHVKELPTKADGAVSYTHLTLPTILRV